MERKVSKWLICHLVRGEPTYDIAEDVEGTPSDPGPWYITSVGWRAYPYWVHELDDLFNRARIIELNAKPTGDWPDYIKKQSSPKSKPKPQPIDLNELGL